MTEIGPRSLCVDGMSDTATRSFEGPLETRHGKSLLGCADAIIDVAACSLDVKALHIVGCCSHGYADGKSTHSPD